MPTECRSPTTPRIFAHALLLVGVCLLAACSGGSSSDKGAPANESARSVTSEPTTPSVDDTDDEDTTSASHIPYSRAEDYPEMVSMPLRYITSSSGKQMGVYVTFPANVKGVPAEGPFPVILVQSAYNLSVSGMAPMTSGVLLGAPDPYIVKRGYVIVGVDALGSGVSQGGWEMLGAAEQAGYGDALDWVLEQPWFNGKLGLAGASYMAITALFTAAQRPDAVQAIFAGIPLGDAQRGTVGTGGMINGVFMSTWMTLTQILTTQNIPAALRFPSQYSTIATATREHIDQIDNYYLPIIEKALNGDPEVTYDGDFWRTRSPIEHVGNIKAPTIIFGSLVDIFQRDEPLLYEQLKQNTDAHLIIYPGDHLGSLIAGFPGGDKVDPMMNTILQWFDHHLKGMDTGTENIPPVTQYVKNRSSLKGIGYATTTDWPHPDATAERWYLHGDMSLSKTSPESAEATHTMATPEFAGIEYGTNEAGNMLKFNITLNDGTQCSPSYRQWTLGGAGVAKAPTCFFDNSKLEQDALNYETAPMTEDYYINGPIQADIWMESSAREAVLSVRVDEVSVKTGKVSPITNGLLLASARAVNEQRSRYMNGEMIQPYHYLTQEAEMPVVPGEVFKMQVEIFPTSVIIRRGYKLRISLSPSNQAQGILNLPRRELAKDGITTIHNSPQYPSSVVLPIVPMSSLN